MRAWLVEIAGCRFLRGRRRLFCFVCSFLNCHVVVVVVVVVVEDFQLSRLEAKPLAMS